MEEELQNKTVLIVDDDERNRFALSNYLMLCGMNVIMAEDGREAIRILEEETTVDIILLDMMMPVMDGYETLEVLKTTDRLNNIPVIAVTAKAMKGDDVRCMEAGAWDYMAKPIDLKKCLEKIRKLTPAKQ
ncbi:MAG TPA: response regulator [Cyclobacteriaceae bacterium]|nr:response regulator [Cyclobacteriaceae bacterium]